MEEKAKASQDPEPMPGPWRIEGNFDDEVGVEILDANGLLVCELLPFTEEWQPEEIANAHLIAAAPEMLAALYGLFRKEAGYRGPLCPGCHMEVRLHNFKVGHAAGCRVAAVLRKLETE